jgi:hypothetical protein
MVLDTLIDAYFQHYHPSYPILHESIFRQKYHSRREVRMQPSWHPIFYLVLAVGDWIVNGGSGAEQPGYYAAARSRMSMRMLESGNLLTVQAFLLLVSLFQSLFALPLLFCIMMMCILTEIGQLSPKARSPEYRIQFHRRRLPHGAGAGLAP